MLLVPQNLQVPAVPWVPVEVPSPASTFAGSVTWFIPLNSANPFRVDLSTSMRIQNSLALPQPSWMSMRIALFSSLHIYEKDYTSMRVSLLHWFWKSHLELLQPNSSYQTQIINVLYEVVDSLTKPRCPDGSYEGCKACLPWPLSLSDFTKNSNILKREKKFGCVLGSLVYLTTMWPRGAVKM